MTIQALIESLVEEWHAEELRPLITRCVLRAYALGAAETGQEGDTGTRGQGDTETRRRGDAETAPDKEDVCDDGS